VFKITDHLLGDFRSFLFVIQNSTFIFLHISKEKQSSERIEMLPLFFQNKKPHRKKCYSGLLLLLLINVKMHRSLIFYYLSIDISMFSFSKKKKKEFLLKPKFQIILQK